MADTTHSQSANRFESANRFDRPLGRGLEEVSRLFLSQPTTKPDFREPTLSRPGEVAPQRALDAGPVLLRPRRAVTRDWLIAALRMFDGAIEENLRAIDANLPCDRCGEIDVLAIDSANQLTVIDADTVSGDDLLLRGIGHVDWIARNVAALRRMYQGQAINFSLQPRLVLVAPQFSHLVKSVARRVGHPRIDFVRCHLVEVSGGGVFFEHLEDQ